MLKQRYQESACEASKTVEREVTESRSETHDSDGWHILRIDIIFWDIKIPRERLGCIILSLADEGFLVGTQIRANSDPYLREDFRIESRILCVFLPQVPHQYHALKNSA